jgi:hypothetical protein
MEIAPLADNLRYEIIIPNWWIEESGLAIRGQNEVYEVTNPQTTTSLSEPTCEPTHAGDSVDGKLGKQRVSASGSFSIEWDESFLMEDEKPILCGFVYHTDGAPNMNPDGSWSEIHSAGFTIASGLETQSMLSEKYHQFSELFNPETFTENLPKHRSYDHAINLLPGTQPPWGPVYPLSELELKTLREFLDTALKSGKISPSRSKAGAPILFVPKAEDRGLRLCVNFRDLNKITIRNRYSLSLMNELRDRVTGVTRFTKLDLIIAYNNIRIKKDNEYKTAFRTRYEHFE